MKPTKKTCLIWYDFKQFIKRSYNYSAKNIPLPSEKLYKIILIEKVELVIKRMRWKAHLYESSSYEATNPLHRLFKSRNCPPQHKYLIQFENDIIELIKSVTFRKLHNKFQNTLQNGINSLKKSRNMFIFADKTRNIHETDKVRYC